MLIRFRRAPVAIFLKCFCKYESKTTIDPTIASCGVTLTPQSPPMFTSSNVYRSVIRRLPFVPNTFYSPMHGRRRRNIQKLLIRYVENSMYVDDVLDSCETTQEARTLQRQLAVMLSDAGFNLRKWLSNDLEVIEEIPPENRLHGIEITDESLPTLKTLGVLWKPQEDVFTFKVKQPTESPTTKRNVLSTIATLFDSLQLLQEIWTAGLDWDETLPNDLKVKWNAWFNELCELQSIHIPRRLRLPNPIEAKFHVFSDASKGAYAAAAYLLCKYDNQDPSCYLVASKCRVAPIKAVTIPRLELMGVVLAARLAKNIRKTLTVDKTTFWTDSTNVLYWIPSQTVRAVPSSR